MDLLHSFLHKLAGEQRDDSGDTVPLNTFLCMHESLNRLNIHMHVCLAFSVIEGSVSEVSPGTLTVERQNKR